MFKRSAVFMLCSMGIASTNVVLADDFIISSAVTTTNGGDTLDGDDSITVTGDGSVTTTLDNEEALFSTGSLNVITNNGELATSGINAHGIYSTSTVNTATDIMTIINTGNITTSGQSSYGIYGLGDYINVENTGTIMTSGADAHGILASGDSNTVTNSGDITVSGSKAVGVFIVGDDTTTANTGTVTANVTDTTSVIVAGDRNTLTNSGMIIASSVGSDGIKAAGNYNTITNSGTVTASDTGAYGIAFIIDAGIGANTFNTITNSGTVIAENGYSIYMEGTDSTLNLEQGSVLVGDVYFSSNDATLNINTGSSAVIQMDSTSITPSETPGTINVLSGVYAVSDSTIYVAELSDYAAQDRVLSTQTRLVHNAVSDRDVNEEGRWNTASAVILNDSGNDSFSGYDGMLFSASLGLERTNQPSLFAGVSIDQIEGEDNFETDSLSAHLGMYDVWREADYILLAGLSYHNTTREQTNNTVSTGKEDASSNYVSLFVSPSLSYSNLLLEGDLLRLRYTGAYNSSHDFDFAEGDLTVEGRLTHQVEVRLAMQNTVADAQLQYGADIGYIDGNIDVTLAGNSVSGSTPADESYSRLFLSMNVGNSQFNAGYSTSKELSLAFAQSF